MEDLDYFLQIVINREHRGGGTSQFNSGELGNRLPAYCSKHSKLRVACKNKPKLVKLPHTYHKVNVSFLITQRALRVPFLIAQRALRVPFLIAQRALKVPFFIKLPCPFLFLG